MFSKNLTHKYCFFWYFEHDNIITWNAIYHEHPQAMKTNKPYFSLGFNWPIIICLITLLFSVTKLDAQCIDGTEESCQCGTAPLLCNIGELNGYTYGMSTFSHPNDGPTPMCLGSQGNNTASHNPTWFAFIAWCNDLTLEVAYTNCVDGPSCGGNNNFGIQAAVYSDCDDLPGSYVDCDTDVAGCVNNSSRELNLTGLAIGDTYYFLVDGCCGSACDIEISVIGACGLGDLSFGDIEIEGPEEVCLPDGDDILYEIDKVFGAEEYYWYVDGVLTDYPLTPLELPVSWSTPGLHEICVDVDKLPVLRKVMILCNYVRPFASYHQKQKRV